MISEREFTFHRTFFPRTCLEWIPLKYCVYRAIFYGLCNLIKQFNGGWRRVRGFRLGVSQLGSSRNISQLPRPTLNPSCFFIQDKFFFTSRDKSGHFLMIFFQRFTFVYLEKYTTIFTLNNVLHVQS